MKKRSKFKRIYVNYIIKSGIIFYAFLLCGVALIIGFSCSTKINKLKTYSCIYRNGNIVLDEECEAIGKTAYFYLNKNEKVFLVNLNNAEQKNGKYYIPYTDKTLNSNEKSYLDVVVGYESLLSKIIYSK